MDKTRNKIFVGCLALLLVMVAGYALFSQSLNITGTAKAQGDFDIEIVRAEITGEKGSAGATATISNDGRALTITIPKLEYPGSYVDVSYDIENKGTVPAIFKNYSITGETNVIKSEFRFENFFYDKGDKQTENIRIYWDKDKNITNEEKTTITLKTNFVQTEGKDAACKTLKETGECLGEYELTGDDTLQCAREMSDYLNGIVGSNNYDFDHDGIITSMDGANILDYLNKINCPTN